MVKHCCVVGCTNKYGKKSGISFYRFPFSDKARCERWIAAVKRKDWTANAHHRICSEHFKGGKPHTHPSHPDYVPTVFPKVYGEKKDDRQVSERFKRFHNRSQRAASMQSPEFSTSREVIESNLTNAQQRSAALDAAETLVSLCSSVEPSSKEQGTQTEIASDSETNLPVHRDASVQVSCNEQLTKDKPGGVSMIEGNDKLTQVFTGLPSWAMFVHLFLFVSPLMHNPLSILSTDNELFLVLLKLRLNLIYEDLAQRFSISTSTVQRIFGRCLDVMYYRLKFLIKWPEREIVRNNLPPVFQEFYPKCVCIIDCSEIFIEIPHNLGARAATYSNYKKHNTVKFLVGVTPNGCVCYLSKCWGGRVSDKQLTQESGFLHMLTPGDTVLADRGFTVEEDVAVFGARLEIPSFTRGKKQLSQREVEQSQQLARVRIHVERVIGLMKNKYTILKGPLPTHLLKHKSDAEVSNIDKVLTICAALCNLSHKIV